MEHDNDQQLIFIRSVLILFKQLVTSIFYWLKKNPVKRLQKNPFADDEAEEEDDGCEYEEDDGENLRLHLSDDEDEDAKEKTEEEDDRGIILCLLSEKK